MKRYVASKKIYNIQIYSNKRIKDDENNMTNEIKEDEKEDDKEEVEENISQVFENKVRLEPLVRDSSKKNLTNKKHN
jgi:transcription termination factor NusB